MKDKDFDGIIRKRLESFEVDFDPESWDLLESRLDATSRASGENAFDDSVRKALEGYTAASFPSGWSGLERQLDAMEEAEAHRFDRKVKHKVEGYQAPYDPESWPVLEEKIAESARLHRRLVMAKAMELVAVLLTILTLYHYYPLIKTSLSKQENKPLITSQYPQAGPDNAQQNDRAVALKDPGFEEQTDPGPTSPHISQNPEDAHVSVEAPSRAKREYNTSSNASIEAHNPQSGTDPPGVHKRQYHTLATRGRMQDLPARMPTIHMEISTHPAGGEKRPVPTHDLLAASMSPPPSQEMLSHAVDHLPQRTATLAVGAIRPQINIRPDITGNTMIRFGLAYSLDVNALFIPRDHFYSQGRPLNFTEKDIYAFGFSLGAMFTFERPRWSVESGLTYSSKRFNPNRILHIGETFDVHTLDFEEIGLNIVAVPVNLRYHVLNKSRWKLYTITGLNFNLIAEAHYDLHKKYDASAFLAPPSAEFIANANEVERVSEHILDGAEFRTKYYFTLNGGLGLEYQINPRMSFYVQPTYMFQIPFSKFHNSNEKHIRNMSILIGSRVPLSR